MSDRRTMESYTAGRAPHLAPRRTVTTRQADGTPRSVVVLVLLMAVASLAIVIGTAVQSYADPVPAPDGLYVVKVDPAPAGPAITVTLSNGARDQLNPCRYEDGRRCYWLADQRGNRVGRSYVVTRGHVFYLNLTRFTS